MTAYKTRTPGEWIRKDNDILSGKTQICRLNKLMPSFEKYGNADLICAAPEMLKALKIAKTIFENQCPSQTDNMKAVYDAIAKAEGK